MECRCCDWSDMPKSVYSRPYERFRELLIQARKDSGLTQNELAKHLNRPQSYVSKYENGERRLDLIEFLQLAHVLSLDVDALIHTLQEQVKNDAS
jgi:transcriptional regulator with XRE-family HTH domain